MSKEQPKIVKVVIDDEATIVDVVVQTVTRSGFYLNEWQAQGLVFGGQVELDARPIRKSDVKVAPGRYTIKVGPSTYEIVVEEKSTE